MVSNTRWSVPRRSCGIYAVVLTIACFRFAGGCLRAEAPADASAPATESSRSAPSPAAATPTVLTSFEQIWRLSEAEKQQSHRVRLDYAVYYYDPLWRALWGRCGREDSYLSLGDKVFPIKPGQLIRVEGSMRPAEGMTVLEPKVTVLAESTALEVLSTAGEMGNTERFNKHLVTVEGYVDRQTVRDANHMEMALVTEGRSVLVQLLLKNEVPAPQIVGNIVRVKGVYFARAVSGSSRPQLEVWVQGNDAITVLGSLARDKRFDQTATTADQLSAAEPGALVRVVGGVEAQEPGESLTLRDATGTIRVLTAQTEPMPLGEEVEAIGFPARAGQAWTLREGLYRQSQTTLTSIDQFYNLPDREKPSLHRVRLDFLVYYYDAFWKNMWGRNQGAAAYLKLAHYDAAVEPGQRILIEGVARPGTDFVVEDPKITVLAKGVRLDAKPTQGQIGNTSLFEKQMVTVEGFVDRQVATDAHHLEVDLITEGRSVVVRLLHAPDDPAPQLEGAIVNLRGVYVSTNDPTGGPPKIEVWSQGPDAIKIAGWIDQDERFKLPATAMEKLAALPADALVKIVGTVRAQQPGKSLTLRDETGQVTVQTMQTQPMQLGERAEVIGYPIAEHDKLGLRRGLYRRSQTGSSSLAKGLPHLRLAEQVRELRPDEAIRSYPVQLSGVVTWSQPEADFFYMADASGGVQVMRPEQRAEKLNVGMRVDVTGVSAPGRFTPVVLAASARSFAMIGLPEVHDVTLEQAMTGVEEARWVSMSGYVRDVSMDGPWARLELTSSGGEFSAMAPPSDFVTKLKGSVVRVRGVCSALTNDKRQLTGVRLWVASNEQFEVEEAVPENPFIVPRRSIASLRQFNSLQAFNRRVRVSGVVIHAAPGRLVQIQDGAEGLLVLSREATPVVPGDRVEAVGFPGRESGRVILREAVYRRIAGGREPAPLEIGSPDRIDAELDGRLVRLEGTLLDVGTQEGGQRLIAQTDKLIFEALIASGKNQTHGAWASGSRVALTGVYGIQFDEYKRPHAVQLQLRSLADVTVLARPSWWTAQHALAVAGVLSIGVVLGLAWVMALRRRVRQQTVQIRAQIETERAARLDAALVRASKLESLGVLAGGIAHDFNNLLTVILGNLSLVMLGGGLDPENEHCLRDSERAALRARGLTQQLLTFAKGGAPVREAINLPDVVRESAEFALHGSKVRCDFDIAPELWPAEVDKAQIGQVVHNIVINAHQAMPEGGVIRIALRNEQVAEAAVPELAAGRYLRMTIADTGKGIASEYLARIFDPYFTTRERGTGLGLATVYSIVKKHGGHVEVASKPGEGTTFRLWLPAAAVSATTAAAAVPEAPSPQTSRILFMDDEETIRRMAGLMLKRLGFEMTAVVDGAETVREYTAAREAGRPYDLVILDLTVPGGMGGSEAMEKLRELDPKVRAIVSSGYSSDPVMANYRAHGFRGMVAKPYELDGVARVINAVLRDQET